jgi:pyruvate dehydrogenase E2 component (dihydrolipoamide acetyltransferase)
MPVEFKLPELGENVEKGDVVRVLVKVGDVVKKDQSVLELETDKATIEVPASEGGTVSEVKVKPGDKVKVGQVVLVLSDAAADSKGKAAPAEAPAKDAPEPQATAGPKAVPAPAPQQAPAAAPAPAVAASATSTPELRPAGRSAAVVAIASARPAPAAEPAASLVAAAPSVRRYARELGVDIGEVSGSGPGGRIGHDDVTKYVKSSMSGGGAARGAAGVRVPPLPDFSKWGEVEARPMSNIRRTTAEHLTAAWQAPHVTQHDKADITTLEEFRHAFGKRAEAAGGKLTVTAILVKIVAAAISRFPQFASSVDMANESIIFKKYCHIGIAVDTPNGLLVPVIRDADQKGIIDVAVELAQLSQKARDKKLTREEMSGGVFSITNLGGIGGSFFTPIINRPEVAILGVSRTVTEPVWRDSAFVPRQMLPLSLSYDHRVIDGADAARFLRFVAEGLEQPLSMQL